MTYIQWSMLRIVINLNNEIFNKLKQVIIILILYTVDYNESF